MFHSSALTIYDTNGEPKNNFFSGANGYYFYLFLRKLRKGIVEADYQEQH
jgi:hypothetical protein